MCAGIPNAVLWLASRAPLEPGPLPLRPQLSQLNVLVQLEHLMSYPVVRAKVAAGTLHLSGWWFDIATGAMYSYERSSRSFAVIDRQIAEQLIARLDGA